MDAFFSFLLISGVEVGPTLDYFEKEKERKIIIFGYKINY